MGCGCNTNPIKNLFSGGWRHSATSKTRKIKSRKGRKTNTRWSVSGNIRNKRRKRKSMRGGNEGVWTKNPATRRIKDTVVGTFNKTIKNFGDMTDKARGRVKSKYNQMKDETKTGVKNITETGLNTYNQMKDETKTGVKKITETGLKTYNTVTRNVKSNYDQMKNATKTAAKTAAKTITETGLKTYNNVVDETNNANYAVKRKASSIKKNIITEKNNIKKNIKTKKDNTLCNMAIHLMNASQKARFNNINCSTYKKTRKHNAVNKRHGQGQGRGQGKAYTRVKSHNL